MANRLYSYRPGLDGVRGVGMVAFMLWHVGVLSDQLPGLWVLINAFFVLSAFLITRLLLAEHRLYGDISITGFYVRRVRRLAPALLVMLTAVTVDGVFFAPEADKQFLRGDIFSTLLYVMNWRLVYRADQYFAAFAHPSITRHAWTLSVEEQFYLLAPLLVLLVLVYLRRRFTRTAVFVVLAAVSALWATTLNLDTVAGQAHAYYGTDIRLQALALGAAAGMWTGHVSRGRALLKPQDKRDVLDQGRLGVEILGWVGLIGSIVAFVFVPTLAPWMFTRGGMLLTTLAGVAWVMGCAQRRGTPLVRLHSFRPAVYTGKISYGLYLYHWPIFLWFERAFPHWGTWPVAVATLVTTFCVAAVSYRYLERPVRQHGWHAFSRKSVRVGQTLTASGVVAMIVGAFAIGGSAPAPGEEEAPHYVLRIPELVPGQPAYVPPHPPAKVGVFGDSVAYLLSRRIPRDNFKGFDVVNLATPGCDLLDEPVHWSDEFDEKPTPECTRGKRDFPSKFKASGADTFLLMPTIMLAVPHDMDGKLRDLDDPVFVKRVTDRLQEVTAQARAAGARTVELATVPCRRMDEVDLAPQYRQALASSKVFREQSSNPWRLNALLTDWARTHDVEVVDLAGAVCQNNFTGVVHGIDLYNDGMHFSLEATPMIWKWMAPQILAARRP